MDILLLSLQVDLDTIGLKYLHYSLLQHSYNSAILFLPDFDSHNDQKLENILKFVRDNSPKLIGVSLMSVEYTKACHLTEYLKKYLKIPVVWGGIHPTIAPEMCLEYADYVGIGECEKTIIDIAHHIANNEDNDLTHINNLCYKENGQVKRNPLYPLTADLDEIPSFEHIPINSYIQDYKAILPVNQSIFKKHARYSGTTYSVMSSRGCPFSCTYCCNNFISRLYDYRKVRRRSIANIIAELKKAKSEHPFIEYINFQDDCFLACSASHLAEFCESYKKEIGIPFVVRSIPVYTTREKIEVLKSSGLAWISLGLQSGSDRVSREIYKRKSLKEDFLKAAKIIKDYNVAAFYDVILDNPFETREDKLETIHTLIEIPKPYYTQFFSLTLYLGTELYARAKEECPEYIEDAIKKDYLLYNKDTLNMMTRLATFISKKQMNKILHLYKEKPDSLSLKIHLFIALLQSSLLFEPLTGLKVIKLSQGGNYLKTLKVLPNYFKEGVMRYIKQFK